MLPKKDNFLDVEIESLDGITKKNLSNDRSINALTNDGRRMLIAEDANDLALVDIANTDPNLGKRLQLHVISERRVLLALVDEFMIFRVG
jgi:hypothetical protein